MRSGASWLAHESVGILTKEILKYILLTVAALVGAWIFTGVSSLAALELDGVAIDEI